ncbi:hypothetical protein [Butyrivibrio sp. MC2013]|uniref:hypothetical protein n=1 Tax=Butyrivibrio sp. MC2013 TaxID=1280686 RepID=UPI00040C7D4E|nr:hypothetical protein [Butyrivibrio sp. MC2013]
MKTWNTPVVEELGVQATAYSPLSGTREDGHYESDDGKYYKPTYGPSSNSGTPEVIVND